MRLITTMLLTGILVVSNVAISGPESATLSKYNRMKQLEGEWVLSPATRQEGKATQHKVVAPLVGTDAVAINFKVIGKGSTVQENLLPDTGKEMATMYHCNDASCSELRAKHYCVKQNQPELRVELSDDDGALVFECDMATELCQSKQNHIHKITHTLSEDGNHLVTSYTTFNDGAYMKDSVYHFDRK
jgi:hypothetical protein